jgi:sugar lactone lactonase YvrE
MANRFKPVLSSTVTVLSFSMLIFSSLLASNVVADSLTLNKATQFDGILFANDKLYGSAGWDGSLIHQITADGIVTKVGLIPKGPIDMVSDHKGNLIITSYGGNSVYRLNPTNGEKEKLVTFPSFAGSILNYKEGEYLVGSDSRIYWFNEQGEYEVFLKDLDRIDNPTGLAMDELRNIYIGNLNRSSILMINDSSRIVSELAQLPNLGKHNIGKLVYFAGNLYASHLTEKTIYQINTVNGQAKVFAGQAEAQEQKEGMQVFANLNSPNGLALDADNARLWISEAYETTKQFSSIKLTK